MRTIPVFYRPEMVAPAHKVSPSPRKPALMWDRWQHRPEVERFDFDPVSRGTLQLAHSRKYIDGVLDLEVDNGFGNRSPEIAASLHWTVGSMVAAARHVLLQDRATSPVACSPTSGFHHAGYNSGAGFCTFNGLIVAARVAIAAGLAKSVLIFDCDYHYGDGTAQIIQRQRLNGSISHWSAGARYTRPEQDSEFFADMGNTLRAYVGSCDLVLYQAGADQHEDDPLGGLLSSVYLGKRDRHVFRICRDYELPLVWNLAGGYQVDESGTPAPVLDLHDQTMQECIDVYLHGLS